MSDRQSEQPAQTDEDHAVSTDNEHAQEGDEGYGDEQESEDAYLNNHDLIGVDGIIRAQKNEIEKKKVTDSANHSARTAN